MAKYKPIPNLTEEQLERFWAKVDFPYQPSCCWDWTAAITGYGYGTWKPSKDQGAYKAHRISYTILIGPIPEGLTLDHLCKNIICINPDHLQPATEKENQRRSHSITGVNGRKKYCNRGHEFVGGNLYENAGKRHCRQCRSDANRARYLATRVLKRGK